METWLEQYLSIGVKLLTGRIHHRVNGQKVPVINTWMVWHWLFRPEQLIIMDQVIYPMETQYREFVDRGPVIELWGWATLTGIF